MTKSIRVRLRFAPAIGAIIGGVFLITATNPSNSQELPPAEEPYDEPGEPPPDEWDDDVDPPREYIKPRRHDRHRRKIKKLIGKIRVILDAVEQFAEDGSIPLK